MFLAENAEQVFQYLCRKPAEKMELTRGEFNHVRRQAILHEVLLKVITEIEAAKGVKFQLQDFFHGMQRRWNVVGMPQPLLFVVNENDKKNGMTFQFAGQGETLHISYEPTSFLPEKYCKKMREFMDATFLPVDPIKFQFSTH